MIQESLVRVIVMIKKTKMERSVSKGKKSVNEHKLFQMALDVCSMHKIILVMMELTTLMQLKHTSCQCKY